MGLELLKSPILRELSLFDPSGGCLEDHYMPTVLKATEVEGTASMKALWARKSFVNRREKGSQPAEGVLGGVV